MCLPVLQFLAFRLGEVKRDCHTLESSLSQSKVRVFTSSIGKPLFHADSPAGLYWCSADALTATLVPGYVTVACRGVSSQQACR
jgi:hypothetical protein